MNENEPRKKKKSSVQKAIGVFPGKKESWPSNVVVQCNRGGARGGGGVAVAKKKPPL